MIYTRYLLGGAFVFASLIKLKGQRFTTLSGANEPINTAFHYFETMYQSGIYWQFIGLGQLVAGVLLMTQRYAKLGALVYFPIITNIFVVTISYEFSGTPIITGGMLLANIVLLLWEWGELKIFFNLPYQQPINSKITRHKIWEITGVALFIFTFVYRLLVDQYDALMWAAVCFIIEVIGLIMGIRNLNTKPLNI